MNKKLLIPILAIGAIIGGFLLLKSKKANTSITISNEDMDEKEPSKESDLDKGQKQSKDNVVSNVYDKEKENMKTAQEKLKLETRLKITGAYTGEIFVPDFIKDKTRKEVKEYLDDIRHTYNNFVIDGIWGKNTQKLAEYVLNKKGATKEDLKKRYGIK